jgi:hypothetical protein
LSLHPVAASSVDTSMHARCQTFGARIVTYFSEIYL